MNICFFAYCVFAYLTFNYSEIKPYEDADVPAIIQRLKERKGVQAVLSLDRSGKTIEDWLTILEQVENIYDFQNKVSSPYVSSLLKNSSNGITHEGINELDNNEKYLFIANHRDIILDSAILNIALSKAGLDTCETAIGDNLQTSRVIKDLTKLNKNFTVIRSAGPREMYENSLTLSHYIREKVENNLSSIWLAQREGRAKDGNDRTQQGLIKMLNLSAGKKSFESSFADLKLRPLSVSYEFDPCDSFKLKEILAVEKGSSYEKEADEDLQNIVAGMNGFKGRIHLSLQDPINDQLKDIPEELSINEKISKLAEIIDHKIFESYQLFENNYVAYDMLYGLNEYQKYYCKEKKEEFEDYISKTTEGLSYEAKKLLIRKYAFPLINWNSIQS